MAHSPGIAFAERAHRTHKEEFYAFYDGDWTVQDITPALPRDHELYYHTHRVPWLSLSHGVYSSVPPAPLSQ